MKFENREYIPCDCPDYEVGTNDARNRNALIMNTTLTKIISGNPYDFMNAIFFRMVFDRCDLRGADFMNALFIQCEFLDCSSNQETDFMNCVLIDTQLACNIQGDAMNAICLNSSLPTGLHMNTKEFDTYRAFVMHMISKERCNSQIRVAVSRKMLTNPRVWDM